MAKLSGRRFAALCGLGLVLSGCSTWIKEDSTPEAIMRERSPEMIRVTLSSGQLIEVANPRVTRDSLFGIIPHSSAAGSPLRAFQVPLDSVQSMSIRERSFTRTVSLVVMAPALVVGSLFLMGL